MMQISQQAHVSNLSLIQKSQSEIKIEATPLKSIKRSCLSLFSSCILFSAENQYFCMKNADISNCGGDFLLMAIFSKLYSQLVSFPKQLPSSVKKLLLKMSQNSKENTCGRVVF